LAAVTETHERVSKPVAHTADPVPPQPTATLAQGEHFLVQVAAYRTRDDAEQKRAALAISGVSAHVESVSLPNGETWHRVRLGPFQSAAAAAAAQGNLRDQGFNGVVMKVKS
jgi:cell division protein FtsN